MPLVKSLYLKNYFLIYRPKHTLRVLKKPCLITVKSDGKENMDNFILKKIVYLVLCAWSVKVMKFWGSGVAQW